MLDTDYKKRVTLPEVRRRLRAYLEGDAEDGLNTMLSKMLCCSWVNFRRQQLQQLGNHLYPICLEITVQAW